MFITGSVKIKVMKAIKISLPKNWNELSERQLESMAQLFHTHKVDRRFHLQVFLILADVRWWQFAKAGKVLRILKEAPLSELRKHYDFIYTTNDRSIFPEYMITKDEAFFSPMARLVNLSAEEFAAAEYLHQLWYKERHRNALQFLAAVLYSTGPNVRPAYEKDLLEKKAALFNDIPLPKLLAMEMAYAGSKNHIVARYPKAFPKSSGGSSRKGKNYGFGKVILHMAGGKFGDHATTRRTNIYTLLEEFEENLKAK